MFCNKCGNQISDTAKFCPKCGNKVDVGRPSLSGASPSGQVPVNQPVSPSSMQPGTPVVATSKMGGIPTQVAGVNIFSIVALGATVIALIFALLPWLETSYMLQGVGAAGNALGQLGSALTGKSSHIATFGETYSAIGFFGLSGALNQYLGTNPYALLLNGVAFFWLIAVGVTIAGAVVMFVNEKHINLVFLGGIALLAFVSLIWSFAYGTLVRDGIASGSPANSMACLVFAIIAIALNVIAIVKPDLLDGK